MLTVRIAGTGSYLPARIVTNAEIAPQLDSTPEWIFTHTGVECRHVADGTESAATMGTVAARSALAAAGAAPKEIGLIVVATSSADYGSYPSTACLIQADLGCTQAAAFDLSAACTGFVYGLEMARCWLGCHPGCKALVVATEVLSRQIDWTDRSNAMLFGDGAGAVVVETAVDTDVRHLSGSLMGADGTGARTIFREAGCRTALCEDPVRERVATMPVPYLKMDGHAVFSFAVRKLEEILRQLCERADIAPNALDLIVSHQANIRILEAVARRIRLPMEKFYLNLSHVGNTSSASVPLCLDHAIREGSLTDGMRIALAGFGAGHTWAGALVEWPYL